MDTIVKDALRYAPQGIVVVGPPDAFVSVAQPDGSQRDYTREQARAERIDPSCLPGVVGKPDGTTTVAMPAYTRSVWEIADALWQWAEDTQQGTVMAALEILGYDPSGRQQLANDDELIEAIGPGDTPDVAEMLGSLLLQLSYSRLDRLS